MRFLAVDPGPKQSGAVDWIDCRLVNPRIVDNYQLVQQLENERFLQLIAIEGVACYGMPVGKDVFDTCIWIGRFIQAFPGPHKLLYRRDIKLHLCNSARAKDTNVRQALIDRFPKTGGGKTPQIGTKKQPGPLYGLKSHIWSALAVAVTCEDTVSSEEIHA